MGGSNGTDGMNETDALTCRVHLAQFREPQRMDEKRFIGGIGVREKQLEISA